jgi:hypothetical protein
MRSNDLLPQADLLLEMLDAQDTLEISFGSNTNDLSSSKHVPMMNDESSSSIYPNQYSNLSGMEIDIDSRSNLLQNRSSSTSIGQMSKQTTNELANTHEHFSS